MILPGVPPIFRSKFESIAHRLQAKPLYLRNIDLNGDEGTLAQTLHDLELQFKVMIGSYPQYDSNRTYQIRLTFEAKSADPVDQAIHAFLALNQSQNTSLFDLVHLDPEYIL
jgi:molybdopterin-biosynthesis enzyme MoeA-like protein